jgi:D-alanine-D-alanine ligase
MAKASKARTRVAIVYGGKSAEREVSFVSARNVAAAIDPEKYELVLIGIDAQGRWSVEGPALGQAIEPGEGAALEALAGTVPSGKGPPSEASAASEVRGLIADRRRDSPLGGVDVLFPLLHGTSGEDGSIQGFARMAGLPCVGADILGSALCMDKDAAKRLMREAGIPVTPFIVFSSSEGARLAREEVFGALGRDVFVKPANLGSSVGISRARTEEEYETSISLAFRYDTKVLVEKTIFGREIEVAVRGRRGRSGWRELEASMPGEVIPRNGFYSYEAKYVDEEGAEILAPAAIAPQEAEACRRLALEACRALCVRGMARVDMFLGYDGRPVASEVNTIPGFTQRSMYPLLWQASGLSLGALIEGLIESAIEEFAERSALLTDAPLALG